MALLVSVVSVSCHISPQIKYYQASKTFQAFQYTVARAPMIVAAPGRIRMLGAQVEFGGLHATRYASGVFALCMGKRAMYCR